MNIHSKYLIISIKRWSYWIARLINITDIIIVECHDSANEFLKMFRIIHVKYSWNVCTSVWIFSRASVRCFYDAYFASRKDHGGFMKIRETGNGFCFNCLEGSNDRSVCFHFLPFTTDQLCYHFRVCNLGLRKARITRCYVTMKRISLLDFM